MGFKNYRKPKNPKPGLQNPFGFGFSSCELTNGHQHQPLTTHKSITKLN